MAKIKWNWETFWKVIKFIFTIGLSHIEKHKNNTNNQKQQEK